VKFLWCNPFRSHVAKVLSDSFAVMLCLYFSHSSILEFDRGHTINYRPRLHQTSARHCFGVDFTVNINKC